MTFSQMQMNFCYSHKSMPNSSKIRFLYIPDSYEWRARGYYGTVRSWQKVWYGTTYEMFRKSTVRKYGIIFPVPYTFRTPVMHAWNIHFSFSPITLSRQLRTPLTTSHSSQSNNNIVNKPNCYAIIIIRLYNHNPAYGDASS